jgi:hypothetical protein
VLIAFSHLSSCLCLYHIRQFLFLYHDFEKPLGLSWVIFGLANITKKSSLSLIILSQSTSFFIFVFLTSLFPADKGAIISQFRVWPFPSITIIAFGERNRNPGYHFAGVNIIWSFYINNIQVII